MFCCSNSATRQRKRNRSAGLTLLEVVIAVSILSVMIALNYKVIMGIVKAKSIVDDQRDGIYIANSVLTRIARELQLAVKTGSIVQCDQSAPPASGNPPIFLGEQKNEGGRGRGDTLTFLAKEAGQYVPDGGTHSGLVQITYRAEPDPDQKDAKNATLLLVRDEVPSSKNQQRACASAIRFPITKNLVSLEFQYFDKRNNEWLPEWAGPRAFTLPSIVQFKVGLRTEEGTSQTYTSAVAIRSSP